MKVDSLKPGDLIQITGPVALFSKAMPNGVGPEGHENMLPLGHWCTVLDTFLSDNNQQLGYFAKVWLHRPIYGMHTNTLRHIGWIWISAAYFNIVLQSEHGSATLTK